MVVFVTPSLTEFFVVLAILSLLRKDEEELIGIKQAMRSLFIQS